MFLSLLTTVHNKAPFFRHTKAQSFLFPKNHHGQMAVQLISVNKSLPPYSNRSQGDRHWVPQMVTTEMVQLSTIWVQLLLPNNNSISLDKGKVQKYS
jgi:hypothetical protein